MLGTSEYADNLFLRLWSYSQRKGRDPLEDFCSEALVWCLRQSVTFRRRFFNLTKLNFLRRNIDLTIHSQQSYEEEDGERAAARKRHTRGRFDIAFEGKDFFVALESKVGSAFGPNQIDKYMRRLEWIKRLDPTIRCALITLTNVREGPLENDENVKHIFWGDVHKQLQISCRANPNESAGESRMLFNILQQFADFLKLKSLAHMNIPRVTSASLREFIELRKGMEEILASLKTSKHLRPLLSKKRMMFEPENDGAYLGIHGNWTPSFYIGFALHQITAGPKMSLYIERALKGRRTDVKIPRELKKSYKKHLSWHGGGETGFVFEQPVDKKLNGDAEAMRLWFHETSKLVLEIGKK